MLQNLKNFLIAFVTGLIVFGLCAIIIIRLGMGAIGGSSQENTNAATADESALVSE